MAKGYLIARVRVHNEDGFKKFLEMTKTLVEQYGGKVLVRSPNPEIREGNQFGLATVIEFENVEKARKFYESKQYFIAKKIREVAADTDLILVKGL